MSETAKNDVWAQGASYERYVGRWSRLVADEFLTWIAIAPDEAWLDVGLLFFVPERPTPDDVNVVYGANLSLLSPAHSCSTRPVH